MFHDVLKDGADPGANLGAAFTASIGETNIPPKGSFLSHFTIGLRGAVSTAAVALEAFVDVLNPFTFKVGQETRIQLRGRDLIALMAWYFKEMPMVWENTDNTGSDFVLGIKIPINEKIDPSNTYTYAATRNAVTNIGSETLALQATYLSDDKGRKPIIAVELPYTTAAATGYTQLGVKMPPLGKMIGLLVFNTTVPVDGAASFSIQRVQIMENGQQTSKLLGACSGVLPAGVADGTLSPIVDVLKGYQVYDFRDEPIDTKAAEITFSVDVQGTSEATRFIAVIEKE